MAKGVVPTTSVQPNPDIPIYLSVALDVTSASQRSHERLFKLEIANKSDRTVELLAISEILPDDAQVVATRGSVEVSARQMLNNLVREVSELLNEALSL